jgi:5S rRNA maturation endonuclease (ribonuclease M5)
MSINRQMRHTKRNRCPVCGGADEDTRGKEKRCHGWTTDDGDWCHCSREELAGSIDAGPDGCFAHRMHGPCRCGMTHGEAKSGATMRDDIEAMYDYKDERGTLLFQVVRKSGKRFLQRRPDGDGWIWQTSGIRRVLFRLPELTADTTKPVYIVEGERDVETLERAGYLATTNPGGAGKWHFVAEMARQTLAGRDVVVIADADGPGREHAKAVADSLTGHASSVRVVEPVSAKDVTDYLEAGGNLDELLYQPPKPSPAQELAPELPFDDIWTKEPDVSLVIPGLGICPGPAHLVTGSWYTGKTLFLMAMGFAVASGRPLFGLHFVKKGRWTHFDHEMGRRGAKRYMQRVQAGLGIPAEEMRGNISLRVLPRLNLCTANAVEMYCELLAGSAICTIDPLRAAAPGQDENSSEFRRWIDMLNVVSDRTGCAICVLHHGGKPVEGAQRRNTGRGTSAIDDAVQSKFVLTAEEKGAPISVSHEKSRELSETIPDFWLQVVNEPDAVRLVHRCEEEMASHLEGAKAAKEMARIDRAKEAVRAAFMRFAGTLPGPRDNVVKVAGGDRTFVQRAISEMLASGEIVRSGQRGEVSFGLVV